MQLADIHLGCGTLPLLRGVKPHVAVKVALEDLLDPATGPAGAAALVRHDRAPDPELARAG